jgi:tetratricopeptide (TPR) repeat protein
MTRTHTLLLALAGLTLGATFPSCSSPQGARLYDGFGNYRRTVTTQSPEAQRWFDQGMQLLYGFNHDEAIRSFTAAAEADPSCGIAHWGIAYAHGLHINNPAMSATQSEKAFAAAQRALEQIGTASAVEAALIRAVARRYQWPAPADRKPLDVDYAVAMGEAWQAFPNDPDVGALYAESLMNLQPWDLWTHDGKPKGRTEEIVAVLERVIELAPRHPGANHFYIHAVEASPNPERATVAADTLCDLVPGSGHLVHMPSHIYVRTGRYADAADANVRAIAADRAYFANAPKPDFYALYFVHNVHFLAYSAMMEGRFETAMNAARDLERDVPPEFLRNYTHLADGLMATPLHVMIRFGKWEEILREPAPPTFRKMSVAMHHYARGIAAAALGRVDAARASIELFDAACADVPADWTVGNNPASVVLKISRKMLEGELAFRERRFDEAFAALREGVRMEDELVYDEPPGWMQPVRHALGALLMAAGRASEAEAVYREDLAKHKDNGWSLIGMREALRAQGREADAEPFVTALSAAWRRAEVQPKSSCYCEPGTR